jgi:hypothetical protein
MSLNSALAFAEAGFPIFPVQITRKRDGFGKLPYIKQWRLRASADPDMIAGWWRQFPNAIVGVPLARCGLVVVDADRHGGPDGIAALRELGEMPPHPIVATAGGGEHHYFAQPDPPITSNNAMAANGIDILGTSRFVVGYNLAPLLALPAPELPEVFRARKARPVAVNQETPTRERAFAGRRALVSPNSREGRYSQAALRNAFAKLADWPRIKVKGKWERQRGRNNKLNLLAYKMGGLIANGWMDEALTVRVLMLGAKECGLVRDDGIDRCLATIYSGLWAGMQVPYPELGPPCSQ